MTRKTVAATLCCVTAVATVAVAPTASPAARTAPVPPAAGTEGGTVLPSRVALTDGTADVWVIGPGEDDWNPFGAKPTVDVTRGVLKHGRDAVRATVRLQDLQRRGLQSVVLRIGSPNPFRRADVWFGPDDRDGFVELRNRDYQLKACPGLGHSVDYAEDRVTVRVPRRCLGDPDWVRLKVAAFLFREWTTLSDNPHNAGPVPRYTEQLYPPQ